MNIWVFFVVVCIYFNYAAGLVSQSCENTALEITCPQQKTIRIYDAFYEKAPNSSHCGNYNGNASACFYSDATSVVIEKCDNKQNCTIYVNSTDFINEPCPNIVKQLTVYYNCVFNPPNPNITCYLNEHKVANTTTCTDTCPGYNCTSKKVPYACVCNKGFLRDPKTNTCVDNNFCPKGDPETSHQIYSNCAEKRQPYCRARICLCPNQPVHRRPHLPLGPGPVYICPGPIISNYTCIRYCSRQYHLCCYPGYICQQGYYWNDNIQECTTLSRC